MRRCTLAIVLAAMLTLLTVAGCGYDRISYPTEAGPVTYETGRLFEQRELSDLEVVTPAGLQVRLGGYSRKGQPEMLDSVMGAVYRAGMKAGAGMTP